MTTTHKMMQAPALTDYEAATAKVIGPDAVLDAPTLQGSFRVYEVTHDVGLRIIEENAKVYDARYSYQRDEKVKGICFIDELECGCVYELPDGPSRERGHVFQKCQEHGNHDQSEYCCEKSVTFPCVCSMSQWCPDHGDQHKGTHE